MVQMVETEEAVVAEVLAQHIVMEATEVTVAMVALAAAEVVEERLPSAATAYHNSER
jgi:hypothetical protein